MLGDYLKYNRPRVDWSAQPDRTERNDAVSRDSAEKEPIPAYAAEQEHEDGYDPYNHPIDRRILEKHLKHKR